MLPYILGVVTLLIYWFLHAQGDKTAKGLLQWLEQNPKTAIVQLGVMFAIIFFRDVLTPYLAIAAVVSVSGSLLAGTAVDKVVKFWNWLTGLFSKKTE